jgi:hypothetical protein
MATEIKELTEEESAARLDAIAYLRTLVTDEAQPFEVRSGAAKEILRQAKV